MSGRLAAWRSLSRSDQRALAGLACFLPVVELSLRLFGMRRTTSWLNRLLPPVSVHQPSAHEMQEAERLAQLAAIAGPRVPVPAHCLSQALLILALLQHRGLDAQLQLGVRQGTLPLDAHAWVQLAGRALAQPSLQHVPLQRPAGDSAAPH